MKRNRFFAFFLACVMTLSLTACGNGKTPPSDSAGAPAETQTPEKEPAEQPEVLEWNLAATLAEDHPMTVALNAFADALAEKTDGRVQIKVYPNMMLGNETEQVEMARAGTAAMVVGGLSTLAVYDDALSVYSLPYIFRSYDDCEKYLSDSEYADEIWESFRQLTNLRFVALELNGARCLSTKNVQVQSVKDLNGVKIRCMDAPLWQDVFTAFGAIPVPIAFTELYVALQTGVVEGQDNPINVSYAQKFYEVQKNIYKTEHNYNTTFVLINDDCWNQLTADEQAAFNELVDEYLYDYYYELYWPYEEEAIQVMKDAGVRIWEQSEFDIQSFWAAADGMINEKYMTNEAYAKSINSIREYFNY